MVFCDGFPVDDILKEDASDGTDHAINGVGHLTEFIVHFVGEFMAEVATGDAVEHFGGFLHGRDDAGGHGAREKYDGDDDNDEEGREDYVRFFNDSAGVGFPRGGEIVGFVDELEDGLEMALVKRTHFLVQDGFSFGFIAGLQCAEEG